VAQKPLSLPRLALVFLSMQVLSLPPPFNPLLISLPKHPTNVQFLMQMVVYGIIVPISKHSVQWEAKHPTIYNRLTVDMFLRFLLFPPLQFHSLFFPLTMGNRLKMSIPMPLPVKTHRSLSRRVCFWHCSLPVSSVSALRFRLAQWQ
jgi:hypothetical protein